MPVIIVRALHAIAIVLALISTAVIAAPGDPIPDVDVSLDRKPPRQTVQHVKTDAQGNFSTGVLPKGTYVLTFHVRPMVASAPAAQGAAPNATPPVAAGAPPQRGGSSAPAPAGSERKSFFESRSNIRVTVSSGAAPVTHTLSTATPQEIVVEAPGGQPIKGRVVE
jgi:hypothetical protein